MRMRRARRQATSGGESYPVERIPGRGIPPHQNAMTSSTEPHLASTTPSASRLLVPDTLRGLAALAVCWFHFTHGNPNFLPDGALKSSGAFGWLGVEMFFVISGFIIPYSLSRGGYRLADYPTFLLKRIIRLDPPYIAALIIILALGYASTAVPGFRGQPLEPNWAQVVLHLGYINVFFGYPWLSPVFWTLAIEFQYYLLMGLLYFAVAHQSPLVRAATWGWMAVLAFVVPSEQFIFHWLFLFMLGMAAFQMRVGLIRRGQFAWWVVILGCGAWSVGSGPIALTGVVTALALGIFETVPMRPLLFLGEISYSLYLLHVPIGGRIINLGQRFVQTTLEKGVVLAGALAASILGAWLLYRFVERPAQRWSSRIRYQRKALCASGGGDATPGVAEPNPIA